MKKLTIILAVILGLLLIERFIFNTSELTVNVSPDHLYASNLSEALITVVPLNLLGFENPFGSVDVIFEIDNGKGLAELVDAQKSSVKVKAKGIDGEVQIGIYSSKSGFLIKRIMIPIAGKGTA